MKLILIIWSIFFLLFSLQGKVLKIHEVCLSPHKDLLYRSCFLCMNIESFLHNVVVFVIVLPHAFWCFVCCSPCIALKWKLFSFFPIYVDEILNILNYCYFFNTLSWNKKMFPDLKYWDIQSDGECFLKRKLRYLFCHFVLQLSTVNSQDVSLFYTEVC